MQGSDFLDLSDTVKASDPRDFPVQSPDVFTAADAADYSALGQVIRHVKGTKGIVAGGAFKNVFSGTPVKDIDVFFRNQTDWEDAYETLVSRGYTKDYEGKRVRALKCPETDVRVELIGNSYGEVEDIFGEPEGILQNFDFTITKAAVFFHEEAWVFLKHRDFFEHLTLKRLVIDADLVKPFSTFERTLRYTGYGYRMCRDSKVTLLQEIQEVEFEDIAQLGSGLYDGID